MHLSVCILSFRTERVPGSDFRDQIKSFRILVSILKYIAAMSCIFLEVSPVNYFTLTVLIGARRSAVGRGTALQFGRSPVRFPMVSLEFFIDIILPAALWPWC